VKERLFQRRWKFLIIINFLFC